MTARGPLSLVKTGTLNEPPCTERGRSDAVPATRPPLKAGRKVPPWQDKAKGNKGDVSARRSLHTFSFSCQAIAQQTKIPTAKPAAESGVPRASIAIELPSPRQDLGSRAQISLQGKAANCRPTTAPGQGHTFGGEEAVGELLLAP